MKEHRIWSSRQEFAAEDHLYRAVLALRSVDECRAFFHDLCTPAELQALKDRWAVAELLSDGLPYREIHERTGVSVTTIGRVARYLVTGEGGYAKVLQRLGK
jgi:TrpR-related protein YerC/YecD